MEQQDFYPNAVDFPLTADFLPTVLKDEFRFSDAMVERISARIPDDVVHDLRLKFWTSAEMKKMRNKADNFTKAFSYFDLCRSSYLVDMLSLLLKLLNGYTLSYQESKRIFGYLSSHQRTEVLLILGDYTSSETWIELFFKEWESCDTCSVFYKEFNTLLERYDFADVRQQYFTEDDWEFFNNLPETITVYRGAYLNCTETGLSWTLDKSIGQKFYNIAESSSNRGVSFLRVLVSGGANSSFFKKYEEMIENDPCLCETTIDKNKTLLFLGRDEQEIIILEKDIDDINII
ncbi:hypothetical protein [Acinetobacter sp. P1(2025)]|uniref:hypothetical protein n=1 Tax=Acinetobacter sp. P1(2025) TaxID=3446120 RepID=UPI003F52BD21